MQVGSDKNPGGWLCRTRRARIKADRLALIRGRHRVILMDKRDADNRADDSRRDVEESMRSSRLWLAVREAGL